MRTAAGDREGYRVATECPHRAVGVLGTGTAPFEWVARPDDAAAQETFRARVRAQLDGLASVHGTGFGGGCAGGPAFSVFLDDWREVDRAIERLGKWMARERLAGEVTLTVESVPVINSAD